MILGNGKNLKNSGDLRKVPTLSTLKWTGKFCWSNAHSGSTKTQSLL